MCVHVQKCTYIYVCVCTYTHLWIRVCVCIDIEKLSIKRKISPQIKPGETKGTKNRSKVKWKCSRSQHFNASRFFREIATFFAIGACAKLLGSLASLVKHGAGALITFGHVTNGHRHSLRFEFILLRKSRRGTKKRLPTRFGTENLAARGMLGLHLLFK